MKNNYYDVTTGKQAELSPLQKMYLELEKIITPRLLEDFCGYNEETQSFDIVLATKEIIEAKEQEYEELRQYHNKCCKENAEKLEQWLEKYNQVSKDFYNGKYCNKENCNLLKTKEQECEELKKQLEQQKALTETYKACYRAKHNDAKDELIRLKQEVKELKEWQEANQPTGICETCTAKSVEYADKCRIALVEIEYVTKELFLGVENKDRPYCEKILNIINKAKEK